MKKQKIDRRSLRYIGRYVKSHGWLITFLTVADCLASLIPVLLAVISKNILEIATGDASGNMRHQTVALIVLVAAQVGLHMLVNTLTVRTRARIEMKLKSDTLGAIFDKKWRATTAFHSGDILTRMTADVNVITDGIVAFIPQVAALIVRLIACIWVLLWLDPRIMWVVLAVGCAFLAVSQVARKYFKLTHKDVQRTDGEVRSFVQENLENTAAVKAFGAGSSMLRRLNVLQQINFRMRLKKNVISNLANAAFRLAFSCSYYLVLAWCAFGLTAGSITVGTMTAFLQIINQIRAPFHSAGGLLPQVYSAMASAERLLELHDLPDEAGQVGDLPRDWRSIRFEDVSFAYDHDHPVLTNFNGVLNKGQFVAVVGHSGIGKSTVIKLLLCLLDPDGGRITLETADGETDWDIGTRPLFAYVPQGNLILSGTIRENICFGRRELSEEELRFAAQTADILSLIDELPDGFDTVIGERGLGLSEGQVQRIAIARAVACGAPILLLDEATSALDEATETRVLENLRALDGKSAFVISHRPGAAKICDAIWNLA